MRNVATLSIGLVYIGGVGFLYLREAGLLAAYLTMPAWYLVAVGVYALVPLVPDSFLDATIFSSAGNLVMLITSAALNAAGLYFTCDVIGRGVRGQELK